MVKIVDVIEVFFDSFNFFDGIFNINFYFVNFDVLKYFLYLLLL